MGTFNFTVQILREDGDIITPELVKGTLEDLGDTHVEVIDCEGCHLNARKALHQIEVNHGKILEIA